MGMQQKQQEKELEEGSVGKMRKVAAIADVVTVNLGILDCPICFHPLHPPIFQVLDLWFCSGKLQVKVDISEQLEQDQAQTLAQMPNKSAGLHKNILKFLRGCETAVILTLKYGNWLQPFCWRIYNPSVSSPFLNALLGMLYVHLAMRSSLTSATSAPFPVYDRFYMAEDVAETMKVDRGPQLHIQLGPTVLFGEDGELITCWCPLEVSSQFVVSSLTLTDPSSDAGWHCHCHALNCYIRILLLTGRSKSPGRWAFVSFVLLVITRGFFPAFSGSGCRPWICSAARLLAVSVAGLSPFFRSSFSMSAMSTVRLISRNIFLNSASTSILDLVSFGSSSTHGYASSTSDAGRPSGKLVISESSSSRPLMLCVRLYE